MEVNWWKMKSKDLAKELLKPLRSKNEFGSIYVSVNDLDQLEANIELFLLRKFEEGRHVGSEHDEKK